MPCGKVADVADKIAAGRASEADYVFTRYKVIVDDEKISHSYTFHGEHVTTEQLVKRVTIIDKRTGEVVRRATRFVSETTHRVCRDAFLSTFEDAMQQALSKGHKTFVRTIEFNEKVGDGFMNAATQSSLDANVGGVIVLSPTKVTGVYVNVQGSWVEKTLFPQSANTFVHATF